MARYCGEQNNTGNNTDHNLKSPDHASARELARPIKQVTRDFSELPHEPSNVDHLGRGDGE
jgi:hypothetical protein